MLRRTTASPSPASGAGVRSMRARPATSATRFRRPVAKWPNASSAGASNTARCARPNIEASQPSLPTSCSISSPTISCAFPSSSPPEAESAHKPENRFGQTEIQQQKTETAWLPQVFQQSARATYNAPPAYEEARAQLVHPSPHTTLWQAGNTKRPVQIVDVTLE